MTRTATVHNLFPETVLGETFGDGKHKDIHGLEPLTETPRGRSPYRV